VKELSSVANQLGRRRTLSETYGAAGWELTFEDMKRLGDWQYALGVNFMNQHLSYMTLKGRRKGDFPQSFLTHAPYWEDFGVLTRYYARLSMALSLGRQINTTLVLEPTTTAWMYYSPTAVEGVLDPLEADFRRLLDSLERHQLEYDLGSENIIKDHGSVRGRSFMVGERAYDTLVLPPHMENLDDTTWALVKQYAANGGRILSFTLPTRVDGVSSDAVQALARNHGNWMPMSAVDDPKFLSLLSDPDFKVHDPQAIQGKVFHHRRRFKDGQLLFWANFNQTGNETVTFSLQGRSATLFDPLSGDVSPLPASVDGNRVTVTFDLPAAGSMLLFIHRDGRSSGAPAEPERSWTVVATEPSKVRATAPNSLTLDYLDLQVQGKSFQDIFFFKATDLAYELNGLERYGRHGHNPWAVAVQYRTNILDMAEKFGAGSGFEATYSFELAAGFRPRELRAVVEWGELYQVKCNGDLIQHLPDEHWLDHSFRVYDVARYLRPGINRLSLSIRPMHIHAEIEPVYLVGDFALAPARQGWKLEPPRPLSLGSWKVQGRPFYGESVLYEKEVKVEQGVRYKVRLNRWQGTVARVGVNGESVGVIGWPPYEFDLTPFLKPGTSRVAVQVVGSLKNLLGPHHGNIRPGIVTPWSWFFAPEKMPAGADYHQLDYGLLEDFEILVAR
jgi:hypothetical protein